MGPEAESDYRQSPDTTCPSCGARGEKAAFFHSSRGLVCEACHKREAAAQRARNAAREGRVDVMLSALLALAAGGGAALFTALATAEHLHGRGVGLFGFGVSVALAARVRVARFPEETPGLPLWRAVASVGAGLAVVAFAALAALVLAAR